MWFVIFKNESKQLGSGGIWTHASEKTGALNQRLGPLGHATMYEHWLLISNQYSILNLENLKPDIGYDLSALKKWLVSIEAFQ